MPTPNPAPSTSAYGYLTRAWLHGGIGLRFIVIVGSLLYLAGPILLLYFSINADSPNLIYVAGVIGLFGMITVGAIALHERALETNQQIAAAEAQIKERPEESKPAWDLARIKLESYLDRNLIQITSIFFLTVLVMIMGFAIIVYGIAKVYANPQLIAPTVVVTVSGIIVEFIGASFLIIYKSTMEQALDLSSDSGSQR